MKMNSHRATVRIVMNRACKIKDLLTNLFKSRGTMFFVQTRDIVPLFCYLFNRSFKKTLFLCFNSYYNDCGHDKK